MIERASDAIPTTRVFRGSASCHRLVELNPDLALAEPEPGCIFVHLNPDNTGHTGFIVEVHPDGMLATIEGNSDAHGSRTGGSVVEGLRAPGYAAHYLEIR